MILYIFHNKKRSGPASQPIYTEMLQDGQLLALIITKLTDTMAGTYICSASYANTEILETSVEIQTYCKYLTEEN